jgi:hypothetical protein
LGRSILHRLTSNRTGPSYSGPSSFLYHSNHIGNGERYPQAFRLCRASRSTVGTIQDMLYFVWASVYHRRGSTSRLRARQRTPPVQLGSVRLPPRHPKPSSQGSVYDQYESARPCASCIPCLPRSIKLQQADRQSESTQLGWRIVFDFCCLFSFRMSVSERSLSHRDWR